MFRQYLCAGIQQNLGRIFALAQYDDFDGNVVFSAQQNRFVRRVLPRLIRIERKIKGVGKRGEHVHLFLRKRRSERGYRIFYAGLMIGDNVHIAFA